MSKVDLTKLASPTPESEIKTRTQAGVKISYVDARFCMDRLDEVCGLGGWSCDYKEVRGLMMCGVSILVDGNWITKWDTGTEANFEKDKSIVSDSFKRACVKWGIGRDLYRIKAGGNATPKPQEQSSGQPTNSSGPPPTSYVVPCGKHKGKSIKDVPVEYIQWYLNQGDKKDAELVKIFTNEFNRRVAHVNV